MSYTLAFDVYGTLINTNGVFQILAHHLGPQALPFMQTWRDKQLEYSFRRGLMNAYVDFSVVTKQALQYTKSKYYTKLSEATLIELMDNYKRLPNYPEVPQVLERLKADGHRIYAFSNGSKSALNNLFSNAGILALFEDLISVEAVQDFKPSPRVYRYFNAITQSTPQDTFLISGNPFDVIGAANYGMKTIWVQRNKQTPFDPWEIPPTETISSLSELPQVFGQ